MRRQTHGWVESRVMSWMFKFFSLTISFSSLLWRLAMFLISTNSKNPSRKLHLYMTEWFDLTLIRSKSKFNNESMFHKQAKKNENKTFLHKNVSKNCFVFRLRSFASQKLHVPDDHKQRVPVSVRFFTVVSLDVTRWNYLLKISVPNIRFTVSTLSASMSLGRRKFIFRRREDIFSDSLPVNSDSYSPSLLLFASIRFNFCIPKARSNARPQTMAFAYFAPRLRGCW